tara:strand:- start:17869 stop:18045 length:177 start_codon:yes stop_codon:yes gene_type:complete
MGWWSNQILKENLKQRLGDLQSVQAIRFFFHDGHLMQHQNHVHELLLSKERHAFLRLI